MCYQRTGSSGYAVKADRLQAGNYELAAGNKAWLEFAYSETLPYYFF